jgi:cyclase
MSFVSNLKKRVIPIILVKDYQVVKSRNFKDFRIFGNLEQTITVFNTRNVDEIVILDIDASKKKLKVNLEYLNILSKNNIMPLSYGGGISTIKDIELCLKHGCDKVVINSQSLKDILFIKEASSVFGKQCIICSVDYIFDEKELKVFSHSNLNTDQINLNDYVNNLIDHGAGEILLTSVKKEGLMQGYDKEFQRIINKDLDIPILINGGCGTPDHMVNAFNENKIDAVCASSIFFYTQYSYADIKKHLSDKNIKVRK